MHAFKLVGVVALGLALSACATWSHSSVEPANVATPSTSAASASSSAPAATVDPSEIIVTERAITDRAYDKLADIDVTVNKSTVFHPDPTRAQAAEQLRAEAAKLGADAVTNVVYGTVRATLWSWGSLDASGTAVKFRQ